MTRSKGRYLTIDGVDGVGKTTVCRKIEQITGWSILHSPSSPFSDKGIREAVDRDCDGVTRAMFYRTAVQHDARWITERLCAGQNVVSDRSPLSTWIYGWDELEGSAQYESLFWTSLPRPDCRVVLTACAATRRGRLSARRTRAQAGARRSEGERIENDQERQNRLQARMIEVGKRDRALIIATDTVEAATIARQIMETTRW